MTWRRLGPTHATADGALQRGMSLLEQARPGDPATLAWWLVDGDALVLGRGSRVSADLDACATVGVAVLRRASGGGPVLWGADLLALDVIVPKGHPWHSDDVAASYRQVGVVLAAAVTRLGVPARAVPPEEARIGRDDMGALACYAGLSPWEVVIGHRKVVGLSQVRRRTGMLVQAGIVLDLHPERLGSLLALDRGTASTLTAALTERATGLHEHIAVTADDVMAAVEAALT